MKKTEGRTPSAKRTAENNPKTVWSGILSFGLVSIPIRLYAGARQERLFSKFRITFKRRL